MKKFLLLTLGCFSLLLSACGTEDGGPATISTVAPPAPGTVMEALFEPSSDPAVPSIVPVPNNAAFADSTDGTLNLKDTYGNPYTDIGVPQGAMNTLDGFSTVAPMTTSFAEALDSTSIAAAVHVYDGSTGAELSFGQDYVAIPNPTDAKILVIKPVKPLKGATNYLVVVTSDLQSATGKPAAASKIFTLMKSPVPLVNTAGVSQIPGVPDANAVALEGLRQTVKPALDVAAAFGIAKKDIVVAWSFKTQTLGKVLAKIQADSATDPYASNVANFLTAATTPSTATGGLGTVDFYTFATQVTVAAGNTALRDAYTASPTNFDTIGSVVIGAVKLPYYLDAAATAQDTAPLTTTFQVDSYGTPTIKSVQTVPFLMTIPKGAAPAALGGKWPVVIFQHGFTVDKSVMFGIANTLSKAGFAVIAIDAVLHGDRTFGLDLVDNATGAPAPNGDGIADSSGKHYLNLSSLLTSRDNIRQTVADLIHLTRLLETQTMDVVNNGTGLPAAGGDGTPDLIVGTVPVSYVGHSNGGILGTILAGVEPAIKTFVFANPGGDYASILQSSAAFSPVVNAGLAAKDSGLVPGSAKYDAFFFAAQTVVDDGDPLNYAAAAVAAGKNILLMKTKDDLVVPNAQTDALSRALGLKQVALTTAAVDPTTGNPWSLGVVDGTATPQAPPALPLGGFTGSGFTFFTQGTHSSFLKPDPANITGQDVITEMQSEALYYLSSGLQTTGATVYIGATPLPSTNAASTVVQ